jgi:hypothetical protein
VAVVLYPANSSYQQLKRCLLDGHSSTAKRTVSGRDAATYCNKTLHRIPPPWPDGGQTKRSGEGNICPSPMLMLVFYIPPCWKTFPEFSGDWPCEKSFMAYSKYAKFQCESLRLQGKPLRPRGERNISKVNMQGYRVSPHGPSVSLNGLRVSLHGFNVSLPGPKVSMNGSRWTCMAPGWACKALGWACKAPGWACKALGGVCKAPEWVSTALGWAFTATGWACTAQECGFIIWLSQQRQ